MYLFVPVIGYVIEKVLGFISITIGLAGLWLITVLYAGQAINQKTGKQVVTCSERLGRISTELWFCIAFLTVTMTLVVRYTCFN